MGRLRERRVGGEGIVTGRRGGARLIEGACGRGRWEGLGTLMRVVLDWTELAKWQLDRGGEIWILGILEGVGVVTAVHRASPPPSSPDELSAWRTAIPVAVRGHTSNSAGSS